MLFIFSIVACAIVFILGVNHYDYVQRNKLEIKRLTDDRDYWMALAIELNTKLYGK